MSSVATVGTFDGIHVGHRAIIDSVLSVSEARNLHPLLVTFANHPLSTIAPSRAPLWAVSREVSLETIRSLVPDVKVVEFVPELAALSAREFMRMLKEKYGVSVLVMGYDNTFGSDRLSSREEYERAAADVGVELVFVGPRFSSDGIEVSSSRLRKAIREWNYPLILELLGAPPEFMARLVEGKHLGRTIGFPTMNLVVDPDITPLPEGVYEAGLISEEPTGSRELPGLLSVGKNPTVGTDNPVTYELHIPRHRIDKRYGDVVYFRVKKKIRDIKKFSSIDHLREAIKSDIASLNLQNTSSNL